MSFSVAVIKTLKMYVYTHVPAFLYVHCLDTGAHGRQKGASDSPWNESYQCFEPGDVGAGKSTSALTAESSFQFLNSFYKN